MGKVLDQGWKVGSRQGRKASAGGRLLQISKGFMITPPGQRHHLLSPLDPKQVRGRRPRLYPFELMLVGDYFLLEGCRPKRVNTIRAAVTHFRYAAQHSQKRFSVLRELNGETASILCVRVA